MAASLAVSDLSASSKQGVEQVLVPTNFPESTRALNRSRMIIKCVKKKSWSGISFFSEKYGILWIFIDLGGFKWVFIDFCKMPYFSGKNEIPSNEKKITHFIIILDRLRVRVLSGKLVGTNTCSTP